MKEKIEVIGVDSKSYLKGYREGFTSAMTMAWALAEQLLINADNSDKPYVQEYINKLKS